MISQVDENQKKHLPSETRDTTQCEAANLRVQQGWRQQLQRASVQANRKHHIRGKTTKENKLPGTVMSIKISYKTKKTPFIECIIPLK